MATIDYTLYHGTCETAALDIKTNGFVINGDNKSWCGKGVYFYDIKDKAWYAAQRKCDEIKKLSHVKENHCVIVSNITVDKSSIFDLRIQKQMVDFQKFVIELFQGETGIKIVKNSNFDEINEKRAMYISFYASRSNKKMIIGCYKMRKRDEIKELYAFSESLNLIFNVETIYCIKDLSIIKSNIIIGGKNVDANTEIV